MARPNLSYLKNLILFLFGLPVGLLTGLTAIAGSVFAVPAVRSLLGLRPARAVGVGLAVTFFAAFTSILSYAQHGFVLAWLALLLAVCQVAGAAWGGRTAARLPILDRLPWLWGTLVIAGGLGMLAQGLGLLGLPLAWHPDFLHRPWFYPEAALIAVGVGLVSRLVGLGGVLMVPAAIYGLGMPPHTAQGTALVVLALASLPGMLIHARRGDVEPQAATWLSAGAVFGGLSGALWAVTTLNERGAIILFGLILAVSGLMLLWRREVATDSAVQQAVPELKPPTVSASPIVSSTAIQEPTEQNEATFLETPLAPMSKDKKESPERTQAEAEPAATPQIVMSQRLSAKALEQKLKDLERIVESKTPEPEGNTHSPPSGETNTETKDSQT